MDLMGGGGSLLSQTAFTRVSQLCNFFRNYILPEFPNGPFLFRLAMLGQRRCLLDLLCGLSCCLAEQLHIKNTLTTERISLRQIVKLLHFLLFSQSSLSGLLRCKLRRRGVMVSKKQQQEGLEV